MLHAYPMITTKDYALTQFQRPYFMMYASSNMLCSLKKSINFWKLVNCNSENYVTPDHIATKWRRYIQALGQFSRLNFTYWETVIPIACISSTLGEWKGLVEKIPISEGNDPHRELWPNV